MVPNFVLVHITQFDVRQAPFPYNKDGMRAIKCKIVV